MKYYYDTKREKKHFVKALAKNRGRFGSGYLKGDRKIWVEQ